MFETQHEGTKAAMHIWYDRRKEEREKKTTLAQYSNDEKPFGRVCVIPFFSICSDTNEKKQPVPYVHVEVLSKEKKRTVACMKKFMMCFFSSSFSPTIETPIQSALCVTLHVSNGSNLSTSLILLCVSIRFSFFLLSAIALVFRKKNSQRLKAKKQTVSVLSTLDFIYFSLRSHSSSSAL